MSGIGFVALVGAGPGDPGLITVKALEYIKRADVIVYDRLVNPDLLTHATEACERVYVGKTPKRHIKTQDEINDILVAEARKGKLVVRLKGGDPFLFGRGGEEAEFLAENGIPFEVVPGVTSAIAAPAYAGIPVTHRDLSSSVVIVTGHEDPEKTRASVDWDSLAHGPDTIVVLMGLGNLSSITERLIKAGKSPDTPIALIQDATTPHQKTVTGSLADIVQRASEAGLRPPAVAVIGEVAGLGKQIAWSETRPLSGKRILVTRARKQASALSFRLVALGAEVIELPAIEIAQSPEHRQALETAIAGIPKYDWLILTSVNGVDLFFDRMQAVGARHEILDGVRIAAIGPETAKAIAGRGCKVAVTASTYTAEGLLDSLRTQPLSGVRVMLARAEGSRPVLPEGLTKMGASVDEFCTYGAAGPGNIPERAIQRLLAGEVDIATFASSSTVKNLVAILEGNVEPLKQTSIACIGPVTAATAEELGLNVAITAREHTIPGLIDAILKQVEVKYDQSA